jgi:hypothetical protein
MDREEEAALELCGRKLFPALGAFTQWTLGRALEEGISRLYFLARDGWFPCRLAQRLTAAWDLPVECRYLYGSRQAWRLSLYREDHSLALDQLCGKGMAQTPEGILRRAGLIPEEQLIVLGELGISGKEFLLPKGLKELKEKLKNCPSFWFFLDAHSLWALPELEGYFRQEGLLDPVPWAVVDSGWMGSTQETLSQLLEVLGAARETMGFYAGLYRGPRSGKWDCFFFRPGKDLPVQAGMEPSFFEGVFTAPQGMTLGYRRESEAVVPVLGEAPPLGEGAIFLGEAFRAMGEELAATSRPRDLCRRALDERPRAWALLHQVMTRPAREEAKVLGALPFSAWEEEASPLATFLTQEELNRNRLAARLLLGKPSRESFWLPGTSALYGKDSTSQFAQWERLRWARVFTYAIRNH